MLNFEIIGNRLNTIWFAPDGTYDKGIFYDYSKQIVVISDDVIEKLKNLVDNVNSPIVDGDVILFKNSTFPKLFLKDIGSKVTRTIKEEKATKIVTDSSNVVQKEDLDNITPCLLIKKSDFYYILYEDNISKYNIDLDKFLADNGFTLVKDAKIVNETLTSNKIENVQYSDKLTTTEQLVHYINNYLPNPTKEQKDCLLSLLKSTEVTNVELGINMIKGINISDCIFDIYKALSGDSGRYYYRRDLTINKINRNNVRWKYLAGLADMKFADFYCFNRSYQNVFHKLYNIYKLSFISLDQKRKCWIQAFSNCNYDNFEKYNDLSEEEKCKLESSYLTKFGFPSRYEDIT